MLELIDNFKQGQNLNDLALVLGISREGVRQRLIHLMGRAAYDGVISSRRRSAKPVKRVEQLSLTEALAFGSSESLAVPPTSAQRSVLHWLVANSIEGEAILGPDGLETILIGSTKVEVRTAIPNPVHREYKMKLHRFKVGKQSSAGAWWLFAICSGHADAPPMAVYVFPDGQVASLRSLNLRYDFFQRPSKWDLARSTAAQMLNQAGRQ